MRIMLLLAAAIFIAGCGNNPGASRLLPKTLADLRLGHTPLLSN